MSIARSNTSNPAGSPRISGFEQRQPKGLRQSAPVEFQRFEALTRKLARVPKGELDEKRRKA
jgi:hypothetical protein